MLTLRVRHAAVARTIGSLQRAGLVSRHPDPPDRGANLARLTPEGEARCAQIDRVWAEFEVVTTAQLTARRRKDVAAISQRITTAINQPDPNWSGRGAPGVGPIEGRHAKTLRTQCSRMLMIRESSPAMTGIPMSRHPGERRCGWGRAQHRPRR